MSLFPTLKHPGEAAATISSSSSDEADAPLMSLVQNLVASETKAAKKLNDQDILESKTLKLLGSTLSLRNPGQLTDFSKIISFSTKHKVGVDFLLDILADCTDKEMWEAFIKNKAVVCALFNWRTLVGQTGNYVMKYMKILYRLPFNVEIFTDFNFVKYVKSVKNKNEKNEEIKRLADAVRKQWQSAAEALSKPQQGSEQPKQKKPKLTQEKHVASNSSFFNRLNTPLENLPKIKLGDTKRVKLNETAIKPRNVNVSSDLRLAVPDVEIPSYKKSSVNVTEGKVSESNLGTTSITTATGKIRKTVRFADVTSLTAICTFLPEQPPSIISEVQSKKRRASDTPSSVVTNDPKAKKVASSTTLKLQDFKATFKPPSDIEVDWPRLKAIYINNNSILVASNSDEALIQKQRENSIPAVVYASEKDIPESPCEPEREPYRHPTKLIQWAFRSGPPPAVSTPLTQPGFSNQSLPQMYAPFLTNLTTNSYTPIPQGTNLSLSGIISNSLNAGTSGRHQPYPATASGFQKMSKRR